jgi:hypothetical protein
LTSNQDVVDYLAEIKFKVNIPDKFKFVDQNRFDIDTRLLAEKHQNSTVPVTELGPSVNTHEENFPHTSNIQRKKRRQARTLVNERASVLTGFETAIENADNVRKNYESVIADSAHSTAKATAVSKNKSSSSVDTNLSDGDCFLADLCDKTEKKVHCIQGKLTANANSKPQNCSGIITRGDVLPLNKIINMTVTEENDDESQFVSFQDNFNSNTSKEAVFLDWLTKNKTSSSASGIVFHFIKNFHSFFYNSLMCRIFLVFGRRLGRRKKTIGFDCSANR